MYINGISFGGFVGGYGFLLGGMSYYPYSSIDVYSSVVRAGNIIGNCGMGCLPRDIGHYIDLLLSRRGVGSESAPPKKERVPEGTDSSDPGTRAASYLREIVNGNELPSQTKVFYDIYGKEKVPKSEKEKDKCLRDIAEKIVGKWIDDPDARSKFARKWQNARNDLARTRALLDPKGDSSYLRVLASYVSGLSKNNMEGNWQAVTDYFVNSGMGDVISILGSQASGIAFKRGIIDERPLDSISKEKYISDLVDRGYDRDEAIIIVDAFGTVEAADEAIPLMNNKQGDTSELKAVVSDKIPRLEQMLNESTQEPKKRQIRDKINEYKKEVERGYQIRAQHFLQNYMKIVEARFGRTPQELGYEAGKLPSGVENVPTAVRWIQSMLSGLGYNVYVPAAPATPAPTTPTTTATAPATTAGTSRPPKPKLTPEEKRKQGIRAKAKKVAIADAPKRGKVGVYTLTNVDFGDGVKRIITYQITIDKKTGEGKVNVLSIIPPN